MKAAQGIEDYLEQIKDPMLELAKKEFLDWLEEAKRDTETTARDNAKKVSKWGVSLATGKLTERDFRLLVDEQKAKLAQFLNTVHISQKARLERITLGLLKILTDRLLDALLALVPLRPARKHRTR